jgi:hypothetical protein
MTWKVWPKFGLSSVSTAPILVNGKTADAGSQSRSTRAWSASCFMSQPSCDGTRQGSFPSTR